jgi:hypothetical protein
MKTSADKTSHFSKDGGTVGEAIMASSSCDRENGELRVLEANAGTIIKSNVGLLI